RPPPPELPRLAGGAAPGLSADLTRGLPATRSPGGRPLPVSAPPGRASSTVPSGAPSRIRRSTRTEASLWMRSGLGREAGAPAEGLPGGDGGGGGGGLGGGGGAAGGP